MRSKLSYAEAVRLLGSDRSRLVEVLDKMTATALIAGVATGHLQILAFFDLRAEAVRLGGELIHTVRSKLQKASGVSRSERIAAAHTILVVTAYFEALDGLKLPTTTKQFNRTTQQKVALAGGSSFEGAHRGLTGMLSTIPAPAPTPARPYESTREEIGAYYRQFSERIIGLIAALQAAQGGQLRDLQLLTERLRKEIPDKALDLYDTNFRRLAADCVDFFLWANLQDHQATRAVVQSMMDETGHQLREFYTTVDQLKTGLAGLEYLYSRGNIGSSGYTASSLAVIGRSEWDEQIADIKTFGASPRLKFPLLAAAYINPSARIAEINSADPASPALPGNESWWERQSIINDIQTILGGLLIDPDATNLPILVLGHPGAGKSMLTRALVARLSEAGFLAVHIELRKVHPDAPIQRQIEEGIEIATGEKISWPELIRSAADAPRAIFLDGLDELLQNSRVSQSDYLELISEFQRREASLGRETAVVVTCRSVGAGRIRFPEGTVVLRLEPFNDHQITQWLSTWKSANRRYFQESRLVPLSPDVALSYRHLAKQPLLLTMLALYDAVDNTLQHRTSIDTGQLYEGLLTRFARREVLTKDGAGNLPEDVLAEFLERELQRLSVIAIAMFNRGRQWVNSEELDSDLLGLIPDESGGILPATVRFRQELNRADIAVGRFFFIHESLMSGDRNYHTYQFMHSTFGEYLVARVVMRALLDIASQGAVASSALALPNALIDDGLLFALTSFQPLSSRRPIVAFLAQSFSSMSVTQCNQIDRQLILIFRRALYDYKSRGYHDYRPSITSTTSRLAVYSANLFLLIALGSRDPIAVSSLFSDDPEPLDSWRRHTSLWRSQFPSLDSWADFADLFEVEHGEDHLGSPDLRISNIFGVDASTEGIFDLGDLLFIDAHQSSRDEGRASEASLRRQLNFLADPQMDSILRSYRGRT